MKEVIERFETKYEQIVLSKNNYYFYITKYSYSLDRWCTYLQSNLDIAKKILTFEITDMIESEPFFEKCERIRNYK